MVQQSQQFLRGEFDWLRRGYSVTVECPILMMKGMSSSIRGAGMYHTTIGTHENASFFAKSAGQEAKYGLFYAYRVGGPPTYIENLCISGPAGYQSGLHNLVGIRMENTNGFYFQSCWFTSFEAGCAQPLPGVPGIQLTEPQWCRMLCAGSGS